MGISGLDEEEILRFQRTGWVGAYSLLTVGGVRRICRILPKVFDGFMPCHLMAHVQQPDAFEERPWFKSMHACVPEFYDIAGHPAIVSRVASILGPDILAWGLTATVRLPGQTHRWHVDVEHRRWPGVSVFIGLEGITQKSTLKVITGSHLIDAAPQDLEDRSDGAVLKEAMRLSPSSELTAVELKEGEFFIFAGGLWHGSKNTDTKTRVALIVQYSPPSARIEVPLGWKTPVRWLSCSPPCVLVSGTDRFGLNRLVGRPDERRTLPARLTTERSRNSTPPDLLQQTTTEMNAHSI
jgi:ectoine hydroxylase-related dioxygenase (phytanoyl-CoA dioxygenase family)